MKIKEFIDTFGVKQTWLAEKIGAHPRTISLVINGKRTLPKKYWNQIVTVTKGLVDFKDLLQEQEQRKEDESKELQERIDAYCRDNRKLPDEKAQGK